MRMDASGLWCGTEAAVARAKEIRSIGNADLQHIRNMTASTHTLRKGFLTLLKSGRKSTPHAYNLHTCVPSSKKQPTTSLLKYLLRITETFVELVRLFKQLYFLFSCSRTRLSPFTPRSLRLQCVGEGNSQRLQAAIAKCKKGADYRLLTARMSDCWKRSQKDGRKVVSLEACNSRVKLLNCC